MVTIGEVHFTKKLINPYKREENTAEGNYITMVLGHTDDTAALPTSDDCRKILMGLGFIPVDDLETFLGQEAMNELVFKLEQKYKEPQVNG